jgi:hypothetical protein
MSIAGPSNSCRHSRSRVSAPAPYGSSTPRRLVWPGSDPIFGIVPAQEHVRRKEAAPAVAACYGDLGRGNVFEPTLWVVRALCTVPVLVPPSHYLNGKENGPLPSSRSDPSLPFKDHGRATSRRLRWSRRLGPVLSGHE